MNDHIFNDNVVCFKIQTSIHCQCWMCWRPRMWKISNKFRQFGMYWRKYIVSSECVD